MKCNIYRCIKKQEMYLYVLCNDDNESDFKILSEDLLRLTGKLEQSMVLELRPELKLARADILEVIRSIREKGYYLQMPPPNVMTNVMPHTLVNKS